MIATLRGLVESVDTSSATIEVGSVGYEVHMPAADLSRLHAGQEAHVWTHLSVSQDAVALYGFLEPSSKRMFLRLLKVSGIGPKVALSLLSTLNPSELARAVSGNDAAALAKAPGLGRKGAQKIILELKGSIDFDAEERRQDDQVRGADDEGIRLVVEGLVSLGWHQSDARHAVAAVCEEQAVDLPLGREDVPRVLRLALASLDRGR